MENRFGIERWPNYVIVRKRRAIAGVSEQITAEKSLGRFFEQKPCFPVMRNVRRIDVPNALAINTLSGCKYPTASSSHGDHLSASDYNRRVSLTT
jgi:hypothetical protein